MNIQPCLSPTPNAMQPTRMKQCAWQFAMLLCCGLLGLNGKALATTAAPFDLQQAINQSETGATLMVPAGHYQGNFVIDRPLILTTQERVILDSQGKGTTLWLQASNIRIEGLIIQNYGQNSGEQDAGIKLNADLAEIEILNNTIRGAGFGIYGEQVTSLILRGNHIQGVAQLHPLDRGDGIHLKRLEAPLISHNRIVNVRDGIYLENSVASLAHDNYFSNLQYGLHYMYSEGDVAYHNTAEKVSGGYAVMDSNDIYLHHNLSRHTSDFGILLNLSANSEIAYNLIEQSHNPDGEELLMTQGKGLFIYGASQNQLHHNLIQGCDTGIHVAMGAEDNQLWGNSFINNGSQVKYVGEAYLQWSYQSKGNYWDDYQGWDFNQDGIGDVAYQPNDQLDRLFWLYPEARLLYDSPVVLLMRWFFQQVPASKLQGVQDHSPLMQAPEFKLPLSVPFSV